MASQVPSSSSQKPRTPLHYFDMSSDLKWNTRRSKIATRETPSSSSAAVLDPILYTRRKKNQEVREEEIEMPACEEKADENKQNVISDEYGEMVVRPWNLRPRESNKMPHDIHTDAVRTVASKKFQQPKKKAKIFEDEILDTPLAAWLGCFSAAGSDKVIRKTTKGK